MVGSSSQTHKQGLTLCTAEVTTVPSATVSIYR